MTESHDPSRLWTELRDAGSRHLSYAQLEGFVDSRLDATEEELVRAHIELCSQCAAELHDLEVFAKSLSNDGEKKRAPERIGFFSRVAQWMKVPRHGWAMIGAVTALIVGAVVLQQWSSRPTALPAMASKEPGASVPSAMPVVPKPEAVLEAPSQAHGAMATKHPGPVYRVLSPAEADEYRTELARAPGDPETRAAIAIKYGLYGEAEKEYRKMETAGGEQAAKASRLMAELKRLRGH